MKKAEHREINLYVESAHEAVKTAINGWGVWNETKLRSCQATVKYTDGFTVLYSYGTLVAAIDWDGIGYDFLRLVYGYTATSAQHISKFFNDYNVTKKFTYRPI